MTDTDPPAAPDTFEELQRKRAAQQQHLAYMQGWKAGAVANSPNPSYAKSPHVPTRDAYDLGYEHGREELQRARELAAERYGHVLELSIASSSSTS